MRALANGVWPSATRGRGRRKPTPFLFLSWMFMGNACWSAFVQGRFITGSVCGVLAVVLMIGHYALNSSTSQDRKRMKR